MIKIIDDLLPENYINAIEDLCYSKDMSWTYHRETIYEETKLKDQNLWEKQFVHSLFMDGNIISEHYKFFMPVLFLLEQRMNYNIKSLLRLKINLLTTAPESNSLFLPHIDYGDKEPYLSAVFYINDSDGDTIIYENNIKDRSVLEYESYQEHLENKKRNEEFVIKQRVEYKRNRVVVFDGSYLHEGSWPTRHKDRLVLNVVFR